jgi:cytochrome c biogenesis protein CcmG, thiol:disulfide interchange protein DsbE
MHKAVNALLAVVLLSVATANFSGCKGGSSSGAVEKPSALADEPNVTFKDLQGNDLTLASLKGRVVLVNFWGTWCEPCRGEIPILIGMQQKYSPKGFTLLGVATQDEEKDVDPFVHNTLFNVGGQQMTMNYPIVMGTDDISTKFGGLIGMPTSFLITRDGKIAKKYIGALNESEVVKDVESQL